MPPGGSPLPPNSLPGNNPWAEEIDIPPTADNRSTAVDGTANSHSKSGGTGRAEGHVGGNDTATTLGRESSDQDASVQTTSEAVSTTKTVASDMQYTPSSLISESTAQLSDRIHIGGFNVQARYLLHALSGVEGLPPVQMLTQNHKPAISWAKEGRSVCVHDHLGNLISDRPFPCPLYVGPVKSRLRSLNTYKGKTPMIDNLVITLDNYSTEPFLRNLKKSISNKTTICLLSDGLGMMEDLNERIFTDPASRPQYVLGMSSHEVSKHVGSDIAIRHRWHKRGSALYLSSPLDEYKPNLPFNELSVPPQTSHLLDLLSRSPELTARRLPWNRFIQRKLPAMVHSSLVDSISVMLGCRYNQIAERKHGRSLWNQMLGETLRIIAAMPEVEPNMVTYFSSPKFRHELWAKLNRQGNTYSKWISLIREGRRPPVDHINGFFVRRAQELGIGCKHNTTATSVVQFKYFLRRDELSNDIGLGLKPYMLDGDKLGGQENGERDESGLDL